MASSAANAHPITAADAVALTDALQDNDIGAAGELFVFAVRDRSLTDWPLPSGATALGAGLQNCPELRDRAEDQPSHNCVLVSVEAGSSDKTWQSANNFNA